jgi:hypothetical protein
VEMSKSEVVAILQRAGFANVIDKVQRVLPDPVDIDRDEPLLARYGITRGALMDGLGSSP